MSRWTVPADDPRYEGDQHPAGPLERAIDKAMETLTGRCRWSCGDVECPERCRNRPGDDTPPEPDGPVPPHIPPGREDLWRRQAEADAEVRRLTALYEAASRKADRLNDIYPAYFPQVRDADAEAERINTDVGRAEAVAERVHQERTAGLSSWIDESPYLPICSACDGTGGPLGSDAHSACTTCRGWGREDDGTPTPPVWSDQDQQWINPATGQLHLNLPPAPSDFNTHTPEREQP